MKKLSILIVFMVLFSISVFASAPIVTGSNPSLEQFNVTLGTIANFTINVDDNTNSGLFYAFTGYRYNPNFDQYSNIFDSCDTSLISSCSKTFQYNFIEFGDYYINASVANSKWESIEKGWYISVINDTEAPVITLNIPDEKLIVFRVYPFECSATDNVGMKAVSLVSTIDGIEICSGTATCTGDYSPTVAGTNTLMCTAEDTSGNIQTITQDINIYSRSSATVCTQNWTLNDTWSECDIFNSQYKNYYDLNNCSNETGKPVDEVQTCIYIEPVTVSASGGNCTLNLISTNSTCQSDNTFTETFIDLNNCYNLTNLDENYKVPEPIIHNCTYVAPTTSSGPTGGGNPGRISKGKSVLNNPSTNINTEPQNEQEQVDNNQGNSNGNSNQITGAAVTNTGNSNILNFFSSIWNWLTNLF